MKFGVVFQQLGQSLQGLIQNAASFPGFHHGDAELIKHFRPLTRGCCQGNALVDVEAHFGERAFEHGQLLLRRHQIEAAHDRHAGIDQGRQLAGCLLYTSPSPRDMRRSRMPSSA